MGIFDTWKRIKEERGGEAAANSERIEVEAGAKLVEQYLKSDADGGDRQILMVGIKRYTEVIRLVIKHWERLAQEKPQEFTPERKRRISQLLHEALKAAGNNDRRE